MWTSSGGKRLRNKIKHAKKRTISRVESLKNGGGNPKKKRRGIPKVIGSRPKWMDKFAYSGDRPLLSKASDQHTTEPAASSSQASATGKGDSNELVSSSQSDVFVGRGDVALETRQSASDSPSGPLGMALQKMEKEQTKGKNNFLHPYMIKGRVIAKQFNHNAENEQRRSNMLLLETPRQRCKPNKADDDDEELFGESDEEEDDRSEGVLEIQHSPSRGSRFFVDKAMGETTATNYQNVVFIDNYEYKTGGEIESPSGTLGDNDGPDHIPEKQVRTSDIEKLERYLQVLRSAKVVVFDSFVDIADMIDLCCECKTSALAVQVVFAMLESQAVRWTLRAGDYALKAVREAFPNFRRLANLLESVCDKHKAQ